MKIVILTNNDVGLYQFRKELIEELIKTNEIIISLPNGHLIESLKKMGCEYIETSMDRRSVNPIKDLKLYGKYRKLLKKEKPDLVITYTIKPNIYGGLACRMLRIPYAMNITGLGTAFQKNGILNMIVSVMYKVSCRKAKTVFFENEGNKQIFIEKRIVKEAITHCLNGAGVNLDRFEILEYPQGEKIKFLFMGRVMAEKGVDELLSAFIKLINDGVNCELDILGSFEEDYEGILEKYEKEGWLHYYGFQKDVRPFINQCHCFVLPSWHEGMANTNLECAASGRPIITSDIYGCKEAVIDGKSGFLVEKKNSYDLYIKMKRFTELSFEDRKTMGLVGRKHMEDVFDKKEVIEETINALRM